MNGSKRMHMSGTWRRWVLVGVLGLVGCRTAGTATRPDGTEPPRQEIHFDPVTVTGDLELEKLNDEELFAEGTSAFAAEDFKQAARYFGRLADFHPTSAHRRAALYNAGLAHERLEEWEEALPALLGAGGRGERQRTTRSTRPSAWPRRSTTWSATADGGGAAGHRRGARRTFR